MIRVNRKDARFTCTPNFDNKLHHTTALLLVLKILELCDHGRDLSLWARLRRADPLFCENFGIRSSLLMITGVTCFDLSRRGVSIPDHQEDGVG